MLRACGQRGGVESGRGQRWVEWQGPWCRWAGRRQDDKGPKPQSLRPTPRLYHHHNVNDTYWRWIGIPLPPVVIWDSLRNNWISEEIKGLL